MKALRIKLTQSSANYKKEETLDNKMTYPLPPISTVIGAIHNACGYREYKEMDISIQGKFESMHREPYTDYCFLNSVMDDRGILIKVKNENLLSSAFEKVATAKKSKGNSFRKGVTIEVHNEALINEYRALKDLGDKISEYKKAEYKEKLDLFKSKKKELSDLKKGLDKKSNEFKELAEKEKELKNEEVTFKNKVKDYEEENYLSPLGKYKSLTTSLKFYEILNNIELVLHIKSDEEILNDILENIYSLKAIGRSEDFVEVVDCKMVTLIENDDCEIVSNNSAYLAYEDVVNENVWLSKFEAGRTTSGTKYYLNKNYEIVNNKRVFEKKKVIYASQYFIEETSKNILIDNDGEEQYIVNFL